MIRSVARKVLARIARRAARDELFEKPGERAPTPPLDDEGDDDEEDESGPVSAAAQVRGGGQEALAAVGGPVLLHHWATWCEPCLEELPRIEALAQALGGRVYGVSWELFDAPGAVGEVATRVQGFCEAQGLSWPSLVWTEGPDALFDAQDMTYRKIPQSRVVAADGEILHEVHGPLDDGALEVVKALLGDAP